MLHCVLKLIAVTSKQVNDGPVVNLKVRSLYSQFEVSHKTKMTDINSVYLIKCGAFDDFIDYLIDYFEKKGYFRRYKSLKADLSRLKGLNNASRAKSFDRNELFLDFAFKNQRGVCLDDVEHIFKILKVETYHQISLTRGFTMLIKESDSMI